MKATGIVRRIDDLGMVVIPKETRKMLGIEVGDPVEFYIENGAIIVKPYHAADEITDLIERIKNRLKTDDYSPKTTGMGIVKLAELQALIGEDKA